MIFLFDVCLNDDENEIIDVCIDGISREEGESCCNVSSKLKMPYVLLEYVEIDKDLEVNRGRSIYWGRVNREGVNEFRWVLSPRQFKDLLKDGPKRIDWLYTLYLQFEKSDIDEYKSISFEELCNMIAPYPEQYKIYGSGKLITRQVERYFDKNGNMQREFTCYLSEADCNNEKRIEKEFLNQGHKIVEDKNEL